MAENNWLHKLINQLIIEIFQAENRRLLAKEQDIVKENNRLTGNSDGFYYQGNFYSNLDVRLRAKAKKNPLHFTMYDTMAKYDKDRKEIEFDKERVKQALLLVLRDCKHEQDIRDALPNSVTNLIPNIKNLPRTREEGFTLFNDERGMKQYHSLVQKIDYYMATRLLY